MLELPRRNLCFFSVCPNVTLVITMSDQTEIVLDEVARARTMRNRAKFMARSKVQQKLILKRINKDAFSLICVPRKAKSTCKKIAKKLEKVRIRYMNLGFSEQEWYELLTENCRVRGLPSYL